MAMAFRFNDPDSKTQHTTADIDCCVNLKVLGSSVELHHRCNSERLVSIMGDFYLMSSQIGSNACEKDTSFC